MRSLVFDTETTGLTIKGAPASHPAQPRLVQLAAILLDHNLEERSSVSLIVLPDIPIPEAASNVHGIGNDIARMFGLPEKAAIGSFLRLCQVADVLVAHNAEFDLLVMQAAAARWNINWKAPSLVRCTMKATTDLCALPPTARMVEFGRTGFKNPNLGESLRAICGRELTGAHDALHDVQACADIYRELARRGFEWEQLREAS